LKARSTHFTLAKDITVGASHWSWALAKSTSARTIWTTHTGHIDRIDAFVNVWALLTASLAAAIRTYHFGATAGLGSWAVGPFIYT
jgi:hypothetical protein